MSRMKRRQFLQFAGSALATLGLSQFDLQRQSLRYGKVLAQDTPRKLALLVGINEYPQSQRFMDLRGCVNDVELQRQLLIHRFGFNDSDILQLTDRQASREGILTAFEEHLINQARPGDVVVFHFSGHGSFVDDPDPIDPSGKNSTFVPADDVSATGGEIVNDIMGQTLFLLMTALKQKTENVTVVLDSCHSGGGTRGNILVRAIDGGGKASETELEYQQKWLSQLKMTREQLLEERRKGVATGVVIASAERDQYAADYPFADFHAGAFTYLLTQYLWQRTNETERVINSIERDLRGLRLYDQSPLIDAVGGNGSKPIYFVEHQTPPAEAVILEVEGNQATVWLGGIAADTQEAFGEDSIFVPAAGGEERTATQLKLLSRNGLIGTVPVEGAIQPGQLLQEYARVIPADLKLVIGLDPSLGNEMAAAKSQLDALNRIEGVTSQAGSEPYTQPVNYILSRMTGDYQQRLQNEANSPVSELPPEGSVGLFSQALELVPDSFGEPGETVTDALSRLSSKLLSLLATRLVMMTLSAESTRLDLLVKMTVENQPGQLIAQAFTPRGCHQDSDECASLGTRGESGQPLNRLTVGDFFQFNIENREANALYVGILLVDPTEGFTVLFPNEYQEGSVEELESASRIEPKQTLLIPDPDNDPFVFPTTNPGLGEVLIVASEKPLTQALLRLRDLAREQLRGKRGAVSTRGEQALDFVSEMLGDLSARGVGTVASRAELKTTEMGSLSITFEVVEQA